MNQFIGGQQNEKEGVVCREFKKPICIEGVELVPLNSDTGHLVVIFDIA